MKISILLTTEYVRQTRLQLNLQVDIKPSTPTSSQQDKAKNKIQ